MVRGQNTATEREHWQALPDTLGLLEKTCSVRIRAPEMRERAEERGQGPAGAQRLSVEEEGGLKDSQQGH